jgi:O-acetyl-ADP-ribose deacetylase (regulator of RNase III)
MIKYIKGNILESPAQAIVNTVNTVGVMGKGIALQFKKAFPSNYKAYLDACKNDEIRIGKLLVCTDSNMLYGEKIIINFPTKTDWRKPSEYEYIEKGLDDLLEIIDKYNIKSIAIPPLGSGNGGLQWEKVKKIIIDKLQNIDIDIYIFEPTKQIKEHMQKERIKLTKARALLLYVLYDLVKNGEYVSEFSSEKICYFLQRFGAKKIFNLEYTPNFYGPYSGKVRYILNILNGSYISGYSDMNKKPFEPLTLVTDGYKTVKNFVHNDPELLEIGEKTKKFLSGFYSDFGLELLSSVDYIISESGTTDSSEVLTKLANWNNRKRSLFSNEKYVDIAINHIKKNAPQQKI